MGTWMAWANEDPSKMLCKRTCTFSDNGMWLTQEPPRRISSHFQFFMLDYSYGWRNLELLSVLRLSGFRRHGRLWNWMYLILGLDCWFLGIQFPTDRSDDPLLIKCVIHGGSDKVPWTH